MDFSFELPWLSTTGRAVAAGLVLFSVAAPFLIPSKRYNRNKIIRVGKSRLQTWLQWDTAPWLSIGKYVEEGYSQVCGSLLFDNRTEKTFS
jgi:hypothetical protein